MFELLMQKKLQKKKNNNNNNLGLFFTLFLKKFSNCYSGFNIHVHLWKVDRKCFKFTD